MRLTPLSFNVIGYPSVKDGIIYFTASYQGNDDVFALKSGDKKIYRLTQGTTGKYFVNAGESKLTWSEFTAEGYQLKQMATDNSMWKPVMPAELEKLAVKVSPGERNSTSSAATDVSILRYRAVVRVGQSCVSDSSTGGGT